MKVHEFTVVVPELDDDLIDEVAGKCPDSGVGTREGTTYIDFDREADSLGLAIDSALADLQMLGVTPVRVLAEMTQQVA